MVIGMAPTEAQSFSFGIGRAAVDVVKMESTKVLRSIKIDESFISEIPLDCDVDSA